MYALSTERRAGHVRGTPSVPSTWSSPPKCGGDQPPVVQHLPAGGLLHHTQATRTHTHRHTHRRTHRRTRTHTYCSHTHTHTHTHTYTHTHTPSEGARSSSTTYVTSATPYVTSAGKQEAQNLYVAHLGRPGDSALHQTPLHNSPATLGRG